MPQTLKAKVVRKQNLTGNYWLFTMEFLVQFDFSAGQFVSIKVTPEGLRRSYSIASTSNTNTIDILIDVSPMGVGCKFFVGLKEGDLVEAMGPMGIFTLAPKKPKTNKMFIATGSGIAPLRSMIGELLRKNKYQGEIKLLWGMRHEEDLFWMDEWQGLKNEFPNFDYDVALSQPGERWHGSCGHVQDCLRDDFMTKVKNISDWEFYLCGGQEMIMETGAYLASQGVVKEDIHFEKFF